MVGVSTMGGYGSSRWYGYARRTTVEDCRQLDINRLACGNNLCGSPFIWGWWNSNGERKAWIGIYPETSGLRLVYTITQYGQKQHMDYPVTVSRVRVGYGERPYFCCPRCGKHCLKLYLNSQYFTCRSCANLSYECQREKPEDRAMRRSRKIRRRIGASMSMADSILPWDKPKRMRWDTFYQLRNEAENLEHKGWQAIAQRLKIYNL